MWGKLFHICFCAHILNLIVQEGLKVLGNALDQIRNSIKYIRGSKTRIVKFKNVLTNLMTLIIHVDYLLMSLHNGTQHT